MSFDFVPSDRASPVSFMGPKRYRPPACRVNELPEVLAAVVISHTHYDHMDKQSIVDLHERCFVAFLRKVSYQT